GFTLQLSFRAAQSDGCLSDRAFLLRMLPRIWLWGSLFFARAATSLLRIVLQHCCQLKRKEQWLQH
ncbi:MAG TPA: hypothetical protein VIQ31_30480, partial [Phormidium sp.]